jgi:hypothetical protein
MTHVVIENIKFQPFSERAAAENHAAKYCAPGGVVRECKTGGFVIQLPDLLVDDAMASLVGYTKTIAEQLFV